MTNASGSVELLVRCHHYVCPVGGIIKQLPTPEKRVRAAVSRVVFPAFFLWMQILSGQRRPGPARLPVVSNTINSEQKRLNLILRLQAGKQEREFSVNANAAVLISGPTLMSGLRLCNNVVLNTLAVLAAADRGGFGSPHTHTRACAPATSPDAIPGNRDGTVVSVSNTGSGAVRLAFSGQRLHFLALR